MCGAVHRVNPQHSTNERKFSVQSHENVNATHIGDTERRNTAMNIRGIYQSPLISVLGLPLSLRQGLHRQAQRHLRG